MPVGAKPGLATRPMAVSTSTPLSSAQHPTNHLAAQRRLKLAIQLYGVAIGLAAAYGALKERPNILAPALALALFWIAIRWTFCGRPIRGGIYAFAVPMLVLVSEWMHGPLRADDVVSTLAPFAMIGIHFATIALIPRTSGMRSAATAGQAAWRAASFVGFGSACATTIVAGATTLGLLWYTFVLGRQNAAWTIGRAWIIAAVLTAGLTLWAGLLAAVYHLREATSRPPLWRTWRGVKLLTFFAILFAGLAFLASSPFTAKNAIATAGGDVQRARTDEWSLFGFGWAVTAEDEAFDPRSLSRVPHLYLDTSVKLASPAIDDATIEHLRDAQNVCELELASPNLSDRSFDVVDSLRFLKSLRIVGTKVTGEALGVGWNGLTSLDTDGAPLTHEGFSAIGQLSFLEQLRLANLHLEEPDVRALASLWYLKELTLENVSLGEDALRPLEEFRARGLDLWIIGLEPTDIPQLAWCPQLTRLDLSNENVADADLAHLHGLRQLRHLDLSNTPIRGPGLRYLARLRGLDEVRLVETQITDPEILVLASLPRTEFVLPETISPFGQALLPYEQARTQFAEGRIDEHGMRAAEREFRNHGEHPIDLLDAEEEVIGVADEAP